MKRVGTPVFLRGVLVVTHGSDRWRCSGRTGTGPLERIDITDKGGVPRRRRFCPGSGCPDLLLDSSQSGSLDGRGHGDRKSLTRDRQRPGPIGVPLRWVPPG